MARLIWPNKDPDEVLDYEIDWSARLANVDEEEAADTIDTSTWIVPDGLTATAQAQTTDKTFIWLSGGTDGTNYELTNRITTVGGRTMDQTVRLKIRTR